ncbi:MAG: hypothetical protein IPO09_01055 [Anaeromyxobacter sp.]|nr:hypothetical protein [Anaeromyxobacter sp.]MBL0278245.1 hypothetical protein [Anaeromyxobacter sp.]
MAETFETKQIDKRVVTRYLRKGLVDEKAYAAHLKALPDLENQVLEMDAALDDDDLDDEDDAE